MLFLKQPRTLPLLCHKSPNACQTDSNNVLKSKLKPDLCNCKNRDNRIYSSSMVATQKGHNHFGTP